MHDHRLPAGFGLERDGATVRILLPAPVRTATHLLEPVLTRADAHLVAAAVLAVDERSPVDRVVLARDSRASEAGAAGFRERLLGPLLDAGVDARIELDVMRAAHRDTRGPRRDRSLLGSS